MSDRDESVVLVTGAAGFIGSHVVDACLALGMRVVGVDDFSGGVESNVPSGCRFVRGDLCDSRWVESLWEEHGPFDVVYHLAAYAAEGLSHFIRRFNYQTNLLASVNLINAAVNHGTGCFVFASSIAVYGRNQLPMTETMTPQPEDPYGISKYAVELDLKAAHELFGLDYVIFRPHNVYGERQNIRDRYRNVIGIFMYQALTGQPMTLFGDGLQTRAFSYIADVAPLIARAPQIAAARNEVFNVGADEAHTVRELAEVVARALDKSSDLRFLDARSEVVHAFADHHKVRAVFDPPPPVSLSDGIQRMADWVQAHPLAPPISFGDIEVRKNLPPSWQ